MLHKKIFSLHCGPYQFTPSYYYAFLTAWLFCVFISLGIWQLHRAAYKIQRLEVYARQSHLPPIDLNRFARSEDLSKKALDYKNALAEGRYATGATFLLDNQFYQHQLGYNVVTAFVLSDRHRWLLIDRGWIPLGKSRQQLPVVVTASNEVKLLGVIRQAYSKSLTLSKNKIESMEGLYRIQNVDTTYLAEVLHHPIYPFVFLLNEDQPGGFKKNWQVVVGQPQKHYAYALQWFAFAAILLVMFVVMSSGKNSND